MWQCSNDVAPVVVDAEAEEWKPPGAGVKGYSQCGKWELKF